MYLFVFTFVVLLVLGVTCIATRNYLSKKNIEGQKMVVAHNFMWILGFVCGMFFMLIGIFVYIQEGATFTCYVFLIFVWLGISLMYGWLGTITLYDEDGFTYGWLPFQRKYYLYSQLTTVRSTLKREIYYVGKRKISFEYMIIDCYEFIAYAEKKYKSIYGKNLPVEKNPPRWDIFNGHVEEPGEFIFIIVMFLAIGFGMLGWTVYDILDYATEEETTRVKAVIEDYYTDENHLILESKVPNCKFDISLYQDYDREIKRVLDEVSKEKPLYVYALKYRDTNNGKGKFEVASVENSKGEALISFEKMNEVHKEFEFSILPFSVCFSIFCILFTVPIFVVGRYPHKFSKRIQKAIFKDGYIH